MSQLKQSRSMSMAETIANLVVGAVMNYFLNALLWAAVMGVTITPAQNGTLIFILTITSIVRSFSLRRIFEAIRVRQYTAPTSGLTS